MQTLSLTSALATTLSMVAVASDPPKRGLNMNQDEIWSAAISLTFSAVSAADGIDEMEANFLAHWYFLKHGGLCGAAAPVTNEDSTWWIAETVIGPNGSDGGPIKIHRKLGIITWTHQGKWTPAPWTDLREFFRMYLEMEARQKRVSGS